MMNSIFYFTLICMVLKRSSKGYRMVLMYLMCVVNVFNIIIFIVRKLGNKYLCRCCVINVAIILYILNIEKVLSNFIRVYY